MTSRPPPDAASRSRLARALYMAGAAAFFALAALGVALPGLPTTPFLLLTSWCLVRGSPSLNEKLRKSPLFGPLLRDWEKHHGVRRHVKVAATTMIVLAAGASILLTDRGAAFQTTVAVLAAIGFVVVMRLRTVR